MIAAPIGVDFDRIDRIARDPGLPNEVARSGGERLDDPAIEVIGVGVDRLDYTKGILERLDAIDRLLTGVRSCAPRWRSSRSACRRDRRCGATRRSRRAIDARVAEINARHGRGPAHGPIRYRKSALKLRPLIALYRLADFCVVSSLHDGMNLVAKEFVAAREDHGGVLVLSEMTGAAQELTDAVLMNPYHVDGFAAGARATQSTCRRWSGRCACARCAGSSRAATSSAGPRDILDHLEDPDQAAGSHRGTTPPAGPPRCGGLPRARRMSAADVQLAAERIRSGASHRHLVLLCDFDGTLSEFDNDPAAVWLKPSPPRAPGTSRAKPAA